MKANDNIPEDEMLLAEAIAAARHWHLGWCRGHAFSNDDGKEVSPDSATHCCALGALYFAGRVPFVKAVADVPRSTVSKLNTRRIWLGNDRDSHWNGEYPDDGESLGYAYRCAMTQDGES